MNVKRQAGNTIDNHSVSSSLEVTPSSQATLNTINNDQCLLDIDEVGVKLRLIEKLINSCKDLIKQSTSIDVCVELFTKNSDNFADTLIQAGSDLKHSCTSILSTIELNRNKITITQREKDKMINRDPGCYERNHKFTEEQLHYFISVGPFQNRLHRFPKNKVLEAAKTTWPGSEKKDEAWTSIGVNIDLMLNSNRRKEGQKQVSILKLNKQVVVTLLDSARYLARQGNFVQLVNLLRRSNNTLNDWFLQTKLEKCQVSYLSKRSQDEYVQLLGGTIEHQIVNEINQSPFISIMIDSTPDLSHQLPSKIGEGISQLLLDTLRRKCISTDKIIGQCYDNAPNMSGVNKGVQACINKQLNREIMHIPCEAHTSNLAVQHACDCSVEFINLFMLLEELYNFFTSSVKRYHCLRNILEQSTFGLTVKSLSDTRWSANYESLHCVVESFSEIIDCLESIESVESKQFDKETTTQAKNIRNKLMSYEFVVLLKFMIAEKLVEPFNINIDQEFDRLHRLRQRSRRRDANRSTAVQLTRESFYIKLFRQVLDHLHATYHDYIQVMIEKLRYF
ncbi:unnamed protein product [Rotaria sordida]|uniref:DUF4371 domain-containing protein n=1 Tax=Rotaria sordida TaxID=392033 RepID=A0A818V6J4_9BILA|nr:unnamed protein product [Rotaria sordida]